MKQLIRHFDPEDRLNLLKPVLLGWLTIWKTDPYQKPLIPTGIP